MNNKRYTGWCECETERLAERERERETESVCVCERETYLSIPHCMASVMTFIWGKVALLDSDPRRNAASTSGEIGSSASAERERERERERENH
jgi:hypothetical protein